MTTRFQSFTQSRMGAFTESRLGARCGEEKGNVVVVFAYQDESYNTYIEGGGLAAWEADLAAYDARRSEAIEAGFIVLAGFGHIQSEGSVPPAWDPIIPYGVEFPHMYFHYQKMFRSPTLADHIAFFRGITEVLGITVTDRTLYSIDSGIDASGSMTADTLVPGHGQFMQWLEEEYPHPKLSSWAYEHENWPLMMSQALPRLPTP